VPVKLSQEEIVTIHVLKDRGESNCSIARTLGVTEGTVRYQLRRGGVPREDGRGDRRFKADAFAGAIRAWVEDFEARRAPGDERPFNVEELHEYLVREHRFDASARSLRRFVAARYPRPPIRPHRRVETPPGAQAQVDWAEFPRVVVGGEPRPLSLFLLTLSYSRKEAAIWSVSKDQIHWLDAHNRALEQIGGVPAVLRIDNVKTALAAGAGPWGVVHPAYGRYASELGFHVDACLPRHAKGKGKVERRVRDVRRRLGIGTRSFESLAALQSYTEERLAASSLRRRCPATGESVEESWRRERELLRRPDRYPRVFDVAVTRRVQLDATVSFEGRVYSVPFLLVGLDVEVRGCAGVVEIRQGRDVVAEHPRGTKERLLIDPAHYEGPGDERVRPPMPLGRLGRRLQEIAEADVELRSIEIYERLAEVAR